MRESGWENETKSTEITTKFIHIHVKYSVNPLNLSSQCFIYWFFSLFISIFPLLLLLIELPFIHSFHPKKDITFHYCFETETERQREREKERRDVKKKYLHLQHKKRAQLGRRKTGNFYNETPSKARHIYKQK